MTYFLTNNDLHQIYEIDHQIKMDGMVIFDMKDKPNEIYTDYIHQFEGLLLSFCRAGSIQIKIGDVVHDIKAGSVLVILPEIALDPVAWSDDYDMVTISISLDFIDRFPILLDFIANTEIINTPLIYPNLDEAEMVDDLLVMICKYYNKPKTKQTIDVLQYLVFGLITAISKAYTSLADHKNIQKTRNKDIIDAFFILLNTHGHLERSVSFYTNQLHLSPQYLSTLIKNKTGKPIKLWISFMVINRSKTLLKTTSLSVKEISDELAFVDASLFCRYFKRCTGITPNAYRDL